MEKDLRKLIEEYLAESKLMQLATSKNNQPWVCNVYFAFDESLNLYWISRPNRRHSGELRENEKVAGTIVHSPDPKNPGRGIQFQGIAKEITDKEEMRVAMKFYAERYGMSPERVEALISGADGHLPYKITPTKYVLFDELNFPDNPYQEYKL
ncbi:pyridoxamine 5'-phosphate oxidase family protein [Acetobacteraceae bacterium]|nr:pyridoxamine 5'-phosphate oxidase family protein [Candidatus Parcubacteria bacterium]